MASTDNQPSESHRFFPSGDWEGFYLYQNDGEKHSMNFSLDFKKGIVSGRGSDDVGGFSWKGTYNSESFTVQMTKQYGTHTIEYSGHADENGIWGKWTYGTDDSMKQLSPELVKNIMEAFADKMNGGFHIWPRQNEQSSVESEVEVKTLKKELAPGELKPLI